MSLPVAGVAAVAACEMSASATGLLTTRDDPRGACPSDILHTSIEVMRALLRVCRVHDGPNTGDCGEGSGSE